MIIIIIQYLETTFKEARHQDRYKIIPWLVTLRGSVGLQNEC